MSAMPVDLTPVKRALRAEIRERRHALTSTERERATAGFTTHLEELVERLGAREISCYLSAPFEPDTRPFLNWALARGIRVLFPVTREDGLLDWVIGDGETETEGVFGVPEAVGKLVGPMALGDVDLILVPAAAVDRTGMRMGWGRGYYDKTLGSMQGCPPVYGVVFDDELVDDVPKERHDHGVDGVVTPTRIVEFG
jgi:5-formyltetrahydrofolate cyclo-ligase